MHHKLDIHPIPENVLYINELSLAAKVPYETKQETEKALTGKTVSDGGILPDDNVRIYVPMDLNADNIMRQLQSLYNKLGYPDDENESDYSIGVGRLISQLEIYDQVRVVRDLANATRKVNGGELHSQQGIALARKMVEFMEQHVGNAECFPYDEIGELKAAFWL